MLTMERKIVFFVLASSILLCARRGNAFVPRPYEELLARIAEKYGEGNVERNVDTRNSGAASFLEIICKNRFKKVRINSETKILFLSRVYGWLRNGNFRQMQCRPERTKT